MKSRDLIDLVGSERSLDLARIERLVVASTDPALGLVTHTSVGELAEKTRQTTEGASTGAADTARGSVFEDSNGNVITYNYVQSATSQQKYLSEIVYGAAGHQLKVTFERETRDDKINSFALYDQTEMMFIIILITYI